MRIVVIGAGAIGSYYAAKLAGENHVTLAVRTPEQAEAIRRHGVRITGLEEATCAVDAVTQVDALEPAALVVLATKAYDSAAASASIAPALRPDTIILCVQNGLHSERVVKDVIRDRCVVLRAITDFGVIFSAPGQVILKARGPTVIEEAPATRELADLFTRAGLDGRVSDDIRRDVWRKLVVNCVINPLTAMTGMEVGWIADARLDPLKQRIIDECAAVARHDGVAFDADVLRMLNERYGPSRNLSSMYQDLSRGKPTEIDYMNGAVVALGRQRGVACPVNESLATIIRTLEQATAARSRIPSPSAS